MEFAAKGTLLQAGDGTGPPEVFTTIAQVRNITGPGQSRDIIDSSHHTTANFWRTKLPGFKDGGEVTFECFFDPADATHKDAAGGFLDDFDTGILRSYKIVLTDTGLSEWDFSAIVSNVEPLFPHEDGLMANVTLTVSGQPLLTT